MLCSSHYKELKQSKQVCAMSYFDQISPQDAKEMAREAALEIIDLGIQTDMGTLNILDNDEGFERVNYSKINPLLRRASGGALRFPDYSRDLTDEHRVAAASVLGDDMPQLDELLDTGLKVVAESARQYWGLMSKTAFSIEPDPTLYTGFHAAIAYLELEAGSPELRDFLKVDEGQYKQVDQAYALAYIYDVASMNFDPMFDQLTRVYLEERKKTSDVPVDLAKEFAKSKEKMAINTDQDIQDTMRVSGLTDDQVARYVEHRLEHELDKQQPAQAQGRNRILN